MGVAPERRENVILFKLRFFGKTQHAFPRFAFFLLPQQPAPKLVARKFVLADAIALYALFFQQKRYARAFAVDADVGDVAFAVNRHAHVAVLAHLVNVDFIDEAPGEADKIKAQRFEQPRVNAVQLKANATAVVQDEFIKHVLALKRSYFAVKAVKIIIGDKL